LSDEAAKGWRDRALVDAFVNVVTQPAAASAAPSVELETQN